LTISIMEALWATILFSGFALEVIIRPLKREASCLRSGFSDVSIAEVSI